MSSERPSVELLLEKYAPLLLSVSGGVSIFYFRDDVAQLVGNKTLNMGNLYSAVLSWASIQIGFAFAVYGFVVGKTQGFVEAARDTHAMRRFISYVKRANIGGFVLTAVSIPLSATSPAPSDPASGSFWIVAGWFSLFIWTFFALMRVAYNFGHLSSVRDQKPFFGA
jgi:hypothetical protein